MQHWCTDVKIDCAVSFAAYVQKNFPSAEPRLMKAAMAEKLQEITPRLQMEDAAEQEPEGV
jgi:acetone carboxylase gamma subunit